MTRDTSVEAYVAQLLSGKITGRRLQVFNIFYELGPLAGAQVAYVFGERHGRTARSETIRNRITELRDMGVVAEVGETKDTNTKMRVTLWDVTSRLPVKLVKRETKSQIITRQAKRIAELEAESRRYQDWARTAEAALKP